MKYALLSYPLSNNTPTFLDNPKVKITPESLISQGGIANWFRLETINHNGTHIDGPWHYNDFGLKLSEIPIEKFIFESISIIDIPKANDQLITDYDLKPHEEKILHSDLLLIQTGFGKYRNYDPEYYSKHSPGFHSSAATYLKSTCKKLRAIGMDIPSASSPANLDEGHEFHRILLGKQKDESFIFIIEDMNLNKWFFIDKVKRIFVIPLIIEEADSAPVTIIAEY